eukprot:7201002-Pyramimonas_sp.AAC.1
MAPLRPSRRPAGIGACLDRVSLTNVLRAAARCVCPAQMWAIALAIYYAPRRIKWAHRYSYMCRGAAMGSVWLRADYVLLSASGHAPV